LSTDNGGSSDDYGTSCADGDRTTFSDAAATAITAASAPFRGTFRPEQPLSIYRGKFASSVNGTWHLRITDDTAGGAGTLHCWSIQILPTVCPPGGGECERCYGFSSTLTKAGQPTQDGRIQLNGITSSCALAKNCPGIITGTRRYDGYTFTNNGGPSCVTVSLSSPCVGSATRVMGAAYLDAYNPASLCANYLADSGIAVTTNGIVNCGFNVPANRAFIVVVNETNSAQTCTSYQLNVTGIGIEPIDVPTGVSSSTCIPRLDIEPLNPGRVLLKWSTSAAGFNLVSTNSLDDTPPPNAFAPIGPAPVVIDSKNVVTNFTTDPARFYELRKP